MDLRFENLKRSYGDKTVLDLTSGHIADGRITGLIGPNGAGKSTFLNIVAGLDKPSEGRILYGCAGKDGSESSANPAAKDGSTIKDSSLTRDGSVIENGSESFTEELPRAQMTLLFQQPYLIHTTVEKNIAYPLKLRKVPKDQIKQRVTDLMAELGLTALAKQRGRLLSGGEMQKTAFARALAFHPELLLMDEPTSNIDAAATAEIERIIKKENSEEGMTMIFVGHNLAQIKRLCHEVIFLNQGKIVESGPTSEILINPQHPETQAFIEGRLLI